MIDNESIDILYSMTNMTAKSDSENRTVQLYVVMTILSFLSVMGTAGNAIVLYVFSKKKDKLVSTLFILVLAFVDFTTCLIIIPYTIYMEYINFMIQYDFLCKLYQFLITSNIPFSALIMVAIAIDRYFCICHPFLHAMNEQRAKIMIAGMGFFAMGLGICVALVHGVYRRLVMEVEVPITFLNDTNLFNENGTFDGFEVSYNASNITTETINKIFIKYDGECVDNDIIIGKLFLYYYQKLFMSLYIVCLVIVIILYTLIYRSVRARRNLRQKQKSKSLQLVLSTTAAADRNGDSSCIEETQLTSANGSRVDMVVKNGPDGSSAVTAAKNKSEPRTKANRKSTRKDRMRMANLKTAAMLFVVTVVFILTFLPAFLMAMQFVTYNMIIFYMYFANNVANPVIYSFMNKNFRDDLRKLFCRGR